MNDRLFKSKILKSLFLLYRRVTDFYTKKSDRWRDEWDDDPYLYDDT